ncbi:MAG: transcriptional repressor [Chromatiales bacterium]|nr:transcriptional repressor [Chromatiales bacterium]
MEKTPATLFERPRHNHRQCIREALRTAERVCAERGLRLTPIRRRVLELVWQQHEPIGAYELLGSLGRDGRPAAPPTVYRALDFLCDAGLVHRLDSLNAFVGCDRAGQAHVGQFLVCASCRKVAEIEDPGVTRALQRAAREAGFALDSAIEVKGLCASCQNSSGDASSG